MQAFAFHPLDLYRSRFLVSLAELTAVTLLAFLPTELSPIRRYPPHTHHFPYFDAIKSQSLRLEYLCQEDFTASSNLASPIDKGLFISNKAFSTGIQLEMGIVEAHHGSIQSPSSMRNMSSSQDNKDSFEAAYGQGTLSSRKVLLLPNSQP